MNNATKELLKLSQEAREISDEIAVLKRRKNIIPDGTEKNSLNDEIKMKKFQVLFYIETMRNLSKTKGA